MVLCGQNILDAHRDRSIKLITHYYRMHTTCECTLHRVSWQRRTYGSKHTHQSPPAHQPGDMLVATTRVPSPCPAPAQQQFSTLLLQPACNCPPAVAANPEKLRANKPTEYHTRLMQIQALIAAARPPDALWPVRILIKGSSVPASKPAPMLARLRVPECS